MFQFSFWIFDALFVAAAAIIMLVIPIMLVWNVRITLAKKREVIFAFGRKLQSPKTLEPY